MFTPEQLHYMQDSIFTDPDNFPPLDHDMIVSIQDEIIAELE